MTDVQILLYDGLDELDAVAPLEVLAAAGFAVTTVAKGGPARVTGGHGLQMGVDAPLGAPPSLLVIPGGGWLRAVGTGLRAAVADDEIRTWVSDCHAAGSVVATVCTGSVMLQAAGLLEGAERPVVTHHSARQALRDLGATVLDDPRVVDDGDLLSAGGVTSGIDLALHLVERYFGPDAAQAGADRIEHERRGPTLVTERGAAVAAAAAAAA